MTATPLWDTSLASGKSSENTIQIIAPAANPKPTGKSGANTATNKNAGTAISGCGRLDTTLYIPARHTATPLGISTSAVATQQAVRRKRVTGDGLA